MYTQEHSAFVSELISTTKHQFTLPIQYGVLSYSQTCPGSTAGTPGLVGDWAQAVSENVL